MTPSTGSGGAAKATPEVARELWQLVRDYAKQETVDPLKGVVRFVTFGILAALLTAAGTLLLSLALLRLLQTETDDTFDGFWSWAPYLITMVIAALVAVFALSRIASSRRKRA